MNLPATLPEANDTIWCEILNAMPISVMLVDRDLKVQMANATACREFQQSDEVVHHRLCGEVFCCMNSYKTPKGCGHSDCCKDCVIRNSVTACLTGKNVQRTQTRIQRVAAGTITPMDVLVTTAPFPDKSKSWVLLMLEDITDTARLRPLIPLCAGCKRVRIDEQRWNAIESFLKKQMSVDVTHGLCPDCTKKYFPEL